MLLAKIRAEWGSEQAFDSFVRTELVKVRDCSYSLNVAMIALTHRAALPLSAAGAGEKQRAVPAALNHGGSPERRASFG